MMRNQQQQQQWELHQQQQQQQQQHQQYGGTVGSSSKCTNRVAAVLSVFLVVCGVLSVIFNSVDIGVNFSPLLNEDRSDEELYTINGYNIFKTTGFVAHGIWSGVMCVTAGMFGLITTCKNGSKCTVFTSLVLSTVCAALAFLQFSIAVLGAWYISYNNREELLDCLTEKPTPEYCLPLRGLLVMEILLAILGFFSGLAAIISSALRCRSMGCCSEYVVSNHTET